MGAAASSSPAESKSACQALVSTCNFNSALLEMLKKQCAAILARESIADETITEPLFRYCETEALFALHVAAATVR